MGGKALKITGDNLPPSKLLGNLLFYSSSPWTERFVSFKRGDIVLVQVVVPVLYQSTL